MIERHFVFDSIEQGAQGWMTDKDGNKLLPLQLADIPEDALKAAAQRLSDAIDADIIAKYLRLPPDEWEKE